jgi:hypothetical protein
LQKKALAGREQRQKDFDAFVGQLKELSKSDKPSEYIQHSNKVLRLTIPSLDCTEGNGRKEVRRGTADPQK